MANLDPASYPPPRRRRALERHGLADHDVVVVGRDSVGPVEPDPAPLLAAVEALGGEPADAFYVGNREKDADTARRAGVPFAYVGGDGPTESALRARAGRGTRRRRR